MFLTSLCSKVRATFISLACLNLVLVHKNDGDGNGDGDDDEQEDKDNNNKLANNEYKQQHDGVARALD